MPDEPAKKPDWSISFVGKLCLIGWICAVLYESFYSIKPIRQIFLLFGFWACVIALLNSLFLLFRRRQGIFLIFTLVAAMPTIYFGLVVRNIVAQKMATTSDEAKTTTRTEPSESVDEAKSKEIP